MGVAVQEASNPTSSDSTSSEAEEVQMFSLMATEEPDGSAEVLFTAKSLFELKELEEDEGSRWLGRRAQVKELAVDTGDAPSEEVLERSEALEPQVEP